MGKLIILAGPSGIGKSPLAKAFGALYPRDAHEFRALVLYNSRTPRPGEQDGRDYFFRSRDHIRRLAEREEFATFDVRGDLQGLDITRLHKDIAEHTVLFEGNPFVGAALVREATRHAIDSLSVFVSPFTAREIRFFADPDTRGDPRTAVTTMMRGKLLRRTRLRDGELSLPALQDIERRAASACDELRLARNFSYIIPNHDGEDSDHWRICGYPVGDAGRAVEAFAALCAGRSSDMVEQWDESLYAILDTCA